LVEAAAEIGEAAGARGAVEQVRRAALDRENMFALDNVAAVEATLALLKQDVAAAMSWAGEFLSAKVGGMIGVADLSRWALQVFTCAKILIAHGTPAQIEQIISPLQSVTESAQSRGLVVEVIQGAVLLACCCWRIEQPVRALRWMQEGLGLGMARGFRRVYYEQEAAVAKMLHTLVQRRVCVEEATLLLGEMAAWSSARQGCKSRGREAAKPPADLYVPLTEREVEVLALLAEKLSNKEIARKLSISTFTVRNHTARIYEKLNVASRAQALAQAKALHLLP
jgi:LuxR family maltose regulon positive regulatory protein